MFIFTSFYSFLARKAAKPQKGPCRFSSNNLNRDFFVLPGGCSLDHGTQGFRYAPLAANDLAHIILGNTELQQELVPVLLLRDLHGLGMIH